MQLLYTLGLKDEGDIVTLINDKAVGGSIPMAPALAGQASVLCLQVNLTLRIFSPQTSG